MLDIRKLPGACDVTGDQLLQVELCICELYKLEKHKQGFWYLILYGMRKCGVIVFKLMSINIKLPYEGIMHFFLL